MLKEVFVLKFILTFVCVHILYTITGFNYNISKDFLSIKTLIDLAIWIIVYQTVSFLIKIYNKKNKESLDN